MEEGFVKPELDGSVEKRVGVVEYSTGGSGYGASELEGRKTPMGELYAEGNVVPLDSKQVPVELSGSVVSSPQMSSPAMSSSGWTDRGGELVSPMSDAAGGRRWN